MQKYPAHNSLLPFYLAWQLNPGGNHYNLSFSYQIENNCYINDLLEALQRLIKLKTHLRQTFALEKDQLIASIHEDLPAQIKLLTISKKELIETEQALVKEGHEINSKSSIKLNIISFNDTNQCVILFNIHHIIMDGYSLDNFIIDLNRLLAGEQVDEETASEYMSKLANEPPLQENPLLEEYIKEINAIADTLSYPATDNTNTILYYTDILPNDILIRLIVLSQQQGISLFNLLLLAWTAFISKLYNQRGALVNYPVNIRTNKSIPGCFVNMVILPLRFGTQDTYLSLIHAWHDKIETLKQAGKFRIRDQLNIDFMPSFAHSNFAQPHELVIQNKRYTAKAYPQIAHANLSVKYREREDGFIFSCELLSGTFSEYFASSLLSRFFNYLGKLLANPSVLLSNTDLINAHERQRLLHYFNNTTTFNPQDKTLIELFEEQTQKTPDNIAIVYEKITLTYSQLNEKANQLAHYLRNYYQIKPDDLIALLLDRNEDMLISILGVLKAGGAYVPLELTYPQERISYILADTKAKVILTSTLHQDKLHSLITNEQGVIALDSHEIQAGLSGQLSTNPIINITSNNLAYVIYTSGTTGKPKGVMIEHKGIVNTLSSLDKVYAPKADQVTKITAFTSYVFDVSVSEFFVALLRGYELHILSNALRKDVYLIAKYINTHQINYIYLPPVLLANLPKIKYPSLQGIIYAGEPCDRETGLYWSARYKLYNYYGPTETSIYATGLQLKSSEVNLIGRPIKNTTAYVLSIEGGLLPIGAIGELFIGGTGLARGYLNRDDLTRERFINNPFQTEKDKLTGENARLYKTGDLVRWLPDGNLEYIGRNDFQVKIKGYRIELGEIESALLRYPGVQQATTVLKNDASDQHNDNKRLVSYYVAEKQLDESKLHDYLATQLPEYMLPSVLIHLKKLPLTINGKLDRSALPDPNFTRINDYLAPSNKKEELVSEAFSKVLGIQSIGVNDDFFRWGGGSLKAIRLVTLLQSHFNINVADVFNFKTPKEIAKNIFFVENNLRQHLEKIKIAYQAKKQNNPINKQLQSKLNEYLVSTHTLTLDLKKKPLVNVLLTGATGFLGCNLLNQLLSLTDYNIFLLVRAHSHEEAFNRINKKFQLYFDKNLDTLHNTRVFVFAADIEKSNLALSETDYRALTTKIDSIIHSAALIKHYGESDKFYSANIQATINLLELSKLTRLKDFHYISTISVLDPNYTSATDNAIYTEEDMAEDLGERSNIYIKTKYEGEKVVVQYRQQGITSNIYRVGNLAFMTSNYRIQENSEDNGFLNRIKCLLNLGILAEEISMEQISPADLTAQALVKLFDKQQLNNHTYHVFNPYLCNIAEIFPQADGSMIKTVPINQFIDTIINLLNNPDYQRLIERFLLHQGWLNERPINLTAVRILQDRTQYILKKLGFEWLPIINTNTMLTENILK